MDQNLHLLNAIYQNAHMASEAIDTLMPKAEETPLYGELGRQQAEYQRFTAKATDLMHAYDQHEPPQPGAIQKAATWAGIQWNTLLDDSASHMAEMMIQGGQMGITDLTRQLKEHCCCDKPVTQLWQDLLTFEQNSLEQMKKYL